MNDCIPGKREKDFKMQVKWEKDHAWDWFGFVWGFLNQSSNSISLI